DPHHPATVRSPGQDRSRHRRLARPGPATGPRARRGRRPHHAHLAQGGRPRRGHGRPAGRRHRRPLDRGRRVARGRDPQARRNHDGAHGRHPHPGEQRGRGLGRAGRGPPGRSLGQADEPERARLLHPQPARRQEKHDPAQV
ncbi:MAG: 3-oxoacyl-[acyl-carrier protein] reductase, partial [uncultured Ramlibacter sp.]